MGSSSQLCERPAEGMPAAGPGEPAKPRTCLPNSVQDQTNSKTTMSSEMRALATALWNADRVDRASEAEWTRNLQRAERVMAQLRQHGAEIFTLEALRAIAETARARQCAAVSPAAVETGDPIHRHPLSWRVPAPPNDPR